MHPELGFWSRSAPAEFVAKELENLGIEVTRAVGKTGVAPFCLKERSEDRHSSCASTWTRFPSWKKPARNMDPRIQV